MNVNYENSGLVIQEDNTAGKVAWQVPSNLAIVKYWGKFGRQQPQNPSISLTLNNAVTKTSVAYEYQKAQKEIALDFYFEGVSNAAFGNKIEKFLRSITPIFPFLNQLHLTVHSTNSFPHSSGIASSASSMAAIAMCLCEIEQKLFNTLSSKMDFLQKASYIARLGSGSASRSVFPHIGLWGDLEGIASSSNFYAIHLEEGVHDVFKTYQDSILIANKGEKSVSSRAGHALMNGNPYAEARYAQARQHCTDLLGILKSGDVEAFGELAELEAMTLHALMMCSTPSYMLMKPNTMHMIDRIRTYRNDTKQPLYFSLDAGPNIHLLYPESIKTDVLNFIKSDLLELCENEEWIADRVGEGPVRF